ncbi:Golgi SNAP receptor complex member 1-1-like isoform X1 [Asparagus officinalis]|uniref:Golgi SNAP receptor complex member 1-1-like isoform X1 n=1 Tax=Asparagus officinalis TaxID=4686 RepID=UPI00098E1ACF|nr:Golgi SNAP receptor complex member 1-1-like isoform X1 [Asparagus officinalis]
MMGFQSTPWDALRSQARKLEAQLDEQLNTYRRIVATRTDGSENDLDSTIDRLLKQLQQVNSQMHAWVSSGGSEILLHTLNRHREILQDLTQEFFRLRSSLEAKQEHASLLDFKDFDSARMNFEEGGSYPDPSFLREQATISRSTGQVKMDNVLSHAQATLGALVMQRSTFSGIGSKLTNVGSRLPTVNHILSSIRRKKSMDTVMLSLVASVCTFLILIYWLTR